MMEIKFTIAKRGTVPAEGGTIRLQPRLEKRPTINAVEFQRSPFRLNSSLSSGELTHALGDLQRVMLHELEKGNAVCLPGIAITHPSASTVYASMCVIVTPL